MEHLRQLVANIALAQDATAVGPNEINPDRLEALKRKADKIWDEDAKKYDMLHMQFQQHGTVRYNGGSWEVVERSEDGTKLTIKKGDNVPVVIRTPHGFANSLKTNVETYNNTNDPALKKRIAWETHYLINPPYKNPVYWTWLHRGDAYGLDATKAEAQKRTKAALLALQNNLFGYSPTFTEDFEFRFMPAWTGNAFAGGPQYDPKQEAGNLSQRHEIVTAIILGLGALLKLESDAKKPGIKNTREKFQKEQTFLDSKLSSRARDVHLPFKEGVFDKRQAAKIARYTKDIEQRKSGIASQRLTVNECAEARSKWEGENTNLIASFFERDHASQVSLENVARAAITVEEAKAGEEKTNAKKKLEWTKATYKWGAKKDVSPESLARMVNGVKLQKALTEANATLTGLIWRKKQLEDELALIKAIKKSDYKVTAKIIAEAHAAEADAADAKAKAEAEAEAEAAEAKKMTKANARTAEATERKAWKEARATDGSLGPKSVVAGMKKRVQLAPNMCIIDTYPYLKRTYIRIDDDNAEAQKLRKASDRKRTDDFVAKMKTIVSRIPAKIMKADIAKDSRMLNLLRVFMVYAINWYEDSSEPLPQKGVQLNAALGNISKILTGCTARVCQELKDTLRKEITTKTEGNNKFPFFQITKRIKKKDNPKVTLSIVDPDELTKLGGKVGQITGIDASGEEKEVALADYNVIGNDEGEDYIRFLGVAEKPGSIEMPKSARDAIKAWYHTYPAAINELIRSFAASGTKRKAADTGGGGPAKR